ncbi:MAG: DeoR family transcriptional regulator [Bacteroidetes bacterium]|nr:DeoR family transcriptional regulator [Bacteroidota bacterium]
MDKHCDHDFLDRIDANPILVPRQKDILRYVCVEGSITRTGYIERTGVSGSTATRDLSEMVLAGWLVRESPGRYVIGDLGIDHEWVHDEFHP